MDALVGALAGGVGGAVVTAWFTARRQRLDHELQLRVLYAEWRTAASEYLTQYVRADRDNDRTFTPHDPTSAFDLTVDRRNALQSKATVLALFEPDLGLVGEIERATLRVTEAGSESSDVQEGEFTLAMTDVDAVIAKRRAKWIKGFWRPSPLFHWRKVRAFRAQKREQRGG